MKNFLILFSVLIGSASFAASPTSFPNGITTPKVLLNDTAGMLSGDADPSVTATDGNKGSIYLRTGSSGGQTYQKQDSGSTTNWTKFSTTAGTITAGENIGGGNGVYSGVSGSNIQLKTLVAGSNVAINPVGNTLVISASGGGGGGSDVSNGGNTYSAPMSLGTLDAQSFSLLTSGSERFKIDSAGHFGIGANPQSDSSGTNHFYLFSTTTGAGSDKNYTGLFSSTVVPSISDGTGYTQGAYVNVHIDADSGTMALARNYFMIEHDGDATLTEGYGIRGLCRIFDNNYPSNVSHGVIENCYGGEFYAHSTSPTADMKHATGIVISAAEAGNSAGTDIDSDVRTAYGIRIMNNIRATGSTTQNIARAIQSDSVAPSAFNGDMYLDSHGSLRFTDNAYHNLLLHAPASMAGSIDLTLPGALGSTGDCIKDGGSGVLGFSACFASVGTGNSLAYTSSQIKSLAAGSGVTISDNGSGTLTIAASGGGGGSGDIVNGGQSGAVSIGTTDSNDLGFKTNGSVRGRFKAGGAFLLGGDSGDFGSVPTAFGLYKFDTADTNSPIATFENYMAYYGNTSNSRDGTKFGLALRPGETTFTYSGEYNGLNASIYTNAAGNVGTETAFKAQASVLNGSAVVSYGTGINASVIAPSGVMKHAVGVKVDGVQAAGTDDSNHDAFGVEITGVSASGSTGTNLAAALRITGGIVGDKKYAILSESTDQSSFAGGVRNATDGTKPTCDYDHRGLQWQTWGGSGVADVFEVCMKDASDAYAWEVK